MLNIFYLEINDTLKNTWREFLYTLPKKNQVEIEQIKNIETQIQKTYARTILKDQLITLGHPQHVLEYVQYDDNGKPFLEKQNIQFNISHSYNVVVLIISNACKVGIDIEKYRPIHKAGFSSFFNEKDWNEIEGTANYENLLLEKWVTQESVLKTSGIGLTKGVNHITIDYNTKTAQIKHDINTYFFNYLNIVPTYVIAYCTQKIKLVPKLVKLKY
jgi:phosphopantetheinyl transferase